MISSCKQKTPVLDSVLSLKDLRGNCYGQRRLGMSALSLNDDDQNSTPLQGGTDDDDINNNSFNIFRGSDRYTFSSISSSSSLNSLGSPLWSSTCTADSSPPSVTRSLQAAVPFSWEDKPGVPNQQCIGTSSQIINGGHGDDDDMETFGNTLNRHRSVELRPPPLYFSSGSGSPESSQFPVFHKHRRHHRNPSYGRRVGRRPEKIDDPFLTALVECTKQGIRDDRARKQGFSCMNTCSVRDAHIAVPRSKAPKDSTQPEAWQRRNGGNASGVPVIGSRSSSNSEWKTRDRVAAQYVTAPHHSLLELMAAQRNRHLVYNNNEEDSKADSLIPPGYYGNPDLHKAAKRDFRSIKAVHKQKQSSAFMEWVSCADVELYQSLLHQ